MQQLTRVSSSWTLYYKIFLPTVWIVFFGALIGVALIMQSLDRLRLHPLMIAGALVFYLLGIVILRFSLLRLQRVELAEDCFYVTNYFKTYKYSYSSIADIDERDLLIMKLTSIRFAEKSAFGKSVHFIQRRKVWTDFTEENAHLFEHLV